MKAVNRLARGTTPSIETPLQIKPEEPETRELTIKIPARLYDVLHAASCYAYDGDMQEWALGAMKSIARSDLEELQSEWVDVCD